MLILDGKKVAEAHRTQLQSQVAEFKAKSGTAPGLAVILVGDDPASQVYVRNKIQECGRVGMESFPHFLPAKTSQGELIDLIKKLNNDSKVNGILVQLPLPKGLSQDEILEALSPKKDPDALTAYSVGKFFTGQGIAIPCTPKGIMSILAHYKIDLVGKNAVVVGRSHIVGRPMAQLLVQADCTVTVCHSKTKNLREFTREADLVVVAAGQPHFLGKEDFKKGAVVVDVGIHRLESADGKKLCGDVRADELKDHVAALTPVPGGVGPMTIISLMENTLALARSAF